MLYNTGATKKLYMGNLCKSIGFVLAYLPSGAVSLHNLDHIVAKLLHNNCAHITLFVLCPVSYNVIS